MNRVRWSWLPVAALALAAGGPRAEAGPQENRVIDVLRVGGAWLGVSLDEVTKDALTRLKLAEERGALVREVEADSPAQKAGLKPEDVILRFQGEAVHTAAQLSRLVREAPVGRTVSLEVSRAGGVQKLQATLSERPRRAARGDWSLDDFHVTIPEPPELPPLPKIMWSDRGPRKLGIEYQEVSDQLAKYFKLADDTGILVTRVEESGAAGKAGVKAGDLILKVDGRPVRESQDLREELRKAEPGKEVTLSLQRDGKPLDLKVKVGGEAAPRRSPRSTPL